MSNVTINPIVMFDQDAQTSMIRCRIETKRLLILSIDFQRDLARYIEIFSNPNNLLKYGNGKPWPKEKIVARVKNWSDRWKSGNPFSALSIHLKTKPTKESTDEEILEEESSSKPTIKTTLIGHFVVGGGSAEGISEMAYVIDSLFQRKKYATEAMLAIKNLLVPHLVKYPVEGGAFHKIEVTCRKDNVPSWKLLDRTGFNKVSSDYSSRFDQPRLYYILDVRTQGSKPEEE